MPSATTARLSVMDFDNPQELRDAVSQRLGDNKTQIDLETKRLEALKATGLLKNTDIQLESLTEALRSSLSISWVCLNLLDFQEECIRAQADAPGKPMPRNEFYRGSKSTFFGFHVRIPLIVDACRIGFLCLLDPERRGPFDDKELLLVKRTLLDIVLRIHQISKSDAADASSSSSTSQAVRKRRSSNDLADLCKAEKERQVKSQSTDAFRLENEGKRSRPNSPVRTRVEETNKCPLPNETNADPDEYLSQLVKAQWPQVTSLKIQSAKELDDFFPKATPEQIARYNMQVVQFARNNNVAKLKEIHQNSDTALDCFNRFGEGLLNLACRRGFTEMVHFLLHIVKLSLRVRDDYGRTPVHDVCWNPTPQLDICMWILQRDPQLFLVADKRGFSPFQYARKSDWHVWREFLYENRGLLEPLVESRFCES